MSSGLQVRALLLLDDRQVSLLLQAHHGLVQALPQLCELQAQIPEPLVGELERLRQWLAIVLAPASHQRRARELVRAHRSAAAMTTTEEDEEEGRSVLTWP